jgi:UDP-N-acetylmuramate dehydrogenase
MLKINEPMSKHCSLRSGGETSEFFQPLDILELSQFLQNNSKPILMVGLGSNLLVATKALMASQSIRKILKNSIFLITLLSLVLELH